VAKSPKRWTKARIRRINESVFCGGYSAHKTVRGWVVVISSSDPRRCWGTYLLPTRALRGRSRWWLPRLLVRALRESIDSRGGTYRVTGVEAWNLVRWCFRTGRPAPLTDEQRKVADSLKRRERPQRVPFTTHYLGYLVERSRRGWVVRVRGNGRGLPRPHVIPFRALGPNGRVWNGSWIVAALRRCVASIDGAVRIGPAQGQRLVSESVWRP
jgi:hypothetical protein